MTSIQHRRYQTCSLLVAAYIILGALHELAHLIVASWLLPSSNRANQGTATLAIAAMQAVIGRYSLIQIDEDEADYKQLILHAGWIFSLVLAIVCHMMHIFVRENQQSKRPIINSIFLSPILPMAAYTTASEAIVTDLLGFVPIHPYIQDSSRLICFCGNFGVLLLNPS